MIVDDSAHEQSWISAQQLEDGGRFHRERGEPENVGEDDFAPKRGLDHADGVEYPSHIARLVQQFTQAGVVEACNALVVVSEAGCKRLRRKFVQSVVDELFAC